MDICTVAVVSDTHGHVDRRVVEIVSACDYAVHAGDIGCAAVLTSLQPRSGTLLAVRGNNDSAEKWPAEDHAVLSALPQTAQLELPGGLLVVIHGDRVLPAKRRHEQLRARFVGARAVVYGHSHRMVEDRTDRPWILNPGAAGRARTFGGPSCMVLTIDHRHWRVKQVRFGV